MKTKAKASSKVYFLIGFYILLNDFLGLSILSQDISLVASLVYLVSGVYIFRRKRSLSFPYRATTCMFLIYMGIILSMLMAKIFYNQSFGQSIITYRFQLLMIAPLCLLRISPSQNEVIISLNYFVLIFVVGLLCSYVAPALFAIDDPYSFHVLPGYILISLPLYFNLQKLTEKWETIRFVYWIALMTILILCQNRSVLFPAVLISGWMFLKIRSRFKPVLILMVFAIAAAGLFYSWDIFQELIDQTQRELADPKYNRNKAFVYFLYKYSPSVWCQIFGNGYLSSHATSLMQNLMEYGVYNSDMGFIGYWNQFGVIPIMVFLYLYISGVVNKRIPLYLKCIAVQTLVCSFTLSYFAASSFMLFFVMYYYLYFLQFAKPRIRANRQIYYPIQCSV